MLVCQDRNEVSRRSGPSETRSLDRTAEAMWHTEKAKETQGPRTPPAVRLRLRGSEPLLAGRTTSVRSTSRPTRGRKVWKESPGGLPHRQVLPLWASVLFSAPLPRVTLHHEHLFYPDKPAMETSTACGAEERTRGRPQNAARSGTRGTGVADLVSSGTRPPFALVAPSSFQLRSHLQGGSMCHKLPAVGVPA